MTEAQRLARILEDDEIQHLTVSRSEIAAELRRLDTVNAQLVEFAREYLSNWGDLEGYLQDMARAAIAATGETK